MANQMPGQIRVDNNLSARGQIDATVNQVADNGLARFVETAAAGFAVIGNRVGALADKAAAKEGAEAGRLAGLDPEFRTRADGTIFGEAFDKAALDVAETRFSQQVENDWDAAATKHAGNPSALNQELATRRMAILASAPAELRPGLELAMRGKSLALLREQTRRIAAERAAEARAAMEAQLDLTLRGMHQKAYALGLDAQADEVLAAETKRLGTALSRRGPDGKRLVAPGDAAKLLAGTQEAVATARISGAFSRLPDLSAKAEFIKSFAADFAGSKGLAKVYDLQGFERVKSGLEADLRSAATEAAAKTRAVKQDVEAVSKMAEKGFAPAPDELAALKSRVTATADPDLGQVLAVAEDTIAWQSAARRLTPAELEALNDGLRARMQKDGASPASVARVELGEQLLGTMRTELKQDPLGWADRVGRIKIAPIDVTSPEAASSSIKARLAQADVVAEVYGQKPKYLRPEEKRMLATTIAKGGSQAMAVATMVASTAGDRAVDVMSELADEAPVMAGLGMLVAQSGGLPSPAAVDAFDALAARQERTEKGGKPLPPTIAPSAADVQQALSNVAGGALSSDLRNEAAAVNAANLVYEMRAARAHKQSFDPDLYKQALSEVLGERTVGGVRYGGIARQSTGWWSPTHDIVLPSNVRQDSWPDVIDALSPSVLERAGIGQPVTGSGKPIDFGRFKRGTLVQIGYGQYLVALGDPAKPGQEQFVSETSAGKPRRLVLDFGKLEPVLARIRPDLFFGGN